MKIIYRADDGKEFDNRDDCENYEWSLEHPDINKVVLFDDIGHKISGSIFSQKVYESAQTVNIPDDKALEDFLIMADFMGFCSYEDIDSPGVWVWNDREYCIDEEQAV